MKLFPLGGPSSLNGVSSSRKEFAPRGANSFLDEVTLLRREATIRRNTYFFSIDNSAMHPHFDGLLLLINKDIEFPIILPI